jgi:hypothetical protein
MEVKMALGNIEKPKMAKLKIDGTEYEIRFTFANIQKLAECFGSATKAEQELYRVCGKKDGTGLTEMQKLSNDFLIVMNNYVSSLVVKGRKDLFLEADVSELQGIVEAIIELQGIALPERKKDGEPADPL